MNLRISHLNCLVVLAALTSFSGVHAFNAVLTAIPPSSRPYFLKNRQRAQKKERFLQVAPTNQKYQDDDGLAKTTDFHFSDYVELIRPVTLLQAVGAFIVGRLCVLADGKNPVWMTICQDINWTKEIVAMLCVYLSYGAGMVANDCCDSSIDTLASHRSNRPIPSGRVSVSNASKFVTLLIASSLTFAISGVNLPFGLWCAMNTCIMLSYALGLQNLLLCKNALVGFLCISPLIGATQIMTHHSAIQLQSINKLWLLAGVGFPIGVAREILKDIEDVKIDQGHKSTIPIRFGAKVARIISFTLVFGTSAALLLMPSYRMMAASKPPWFLMSWVVSTTMCLRASRMSDLIRQQKQVKYSIYFLLLGFIAGLVAQ